MSKNKTYHWLDLLMNKNIQMLLAVGAMFLTISFTFVRTANKRVTKVDVTIDHKENQYFVDEVDIIHILSDSAGDMIIDKKISQINTYTLEQKMKDLMFVEKAQLYRQHNGTVHVEVKQRKPIARLLCTSGPNFYLTDNGIVLPMSDKYTPRVMVITGKYADTLSSMQFIQTEKGQTYLKLLNDIDQSEYLRRLIAQIDTNIDGELTLYAIIGSYWIDWGTSEYSEEKIKKIEYLYKKLLPAKGWDTYKNINLKYRNQIVCR